MCRRLISKTAALLLCVFMLAALFPRMSLTAFAATPRHTQIYLDDADTIETIIQKVEGETSQYIAERLRLLIFGDGTSNIYSVGKPFPSSSSYQTLIDGEITQNGEPLSVKMQSAQCFAYCEWAYYKFFGSAKWNGGGYMQHSVAVKMSEANVKKALSASRCGDHVRFADQHSVTFLTLDEQENGFYYLESVNDSSGKYYVRLCHTTFALVVSCYGSKRSITWIQTPQEYPNAESNAQLSLIDAKIPTNVKTGSGADVIGTTVMSDCDITSVTAGVYSQNGEEQFCVNVTPNCGAFRFGKIADSLFGFSALAAGKYTYRLTAADESGAEVSVEKDFTVSSSAAAYTYENASAKSRVSGISVASPPNKTDYTQGEELSPAGFKLLVTFDDGSVSEKISGFRLSYDFSSAGTAPVTVSYAGLTTQFYVNVHPLTGAEIWKVNVSNTLRVRSGAGTEYDQVTSYRTGTLIKITEITETGGNVWGKTDDGWVALSYNQSDYCLYVSGGLYRVSYSENGGSSAPINTVKPYGQTVKIPSETPTRENHTFKGWSTDPVAAEAEYLPGDGYTENASVTLYAVWDFCGDLSFAGSSVSLASDLTFRAFVAKSRFETGAFTDPRVEFTLNGRTSSVNEYKEDGDYYVFDFQNISPNEMNDKIRAVLFASHNGTEYSSDTAEWSIASYCIRLLGSARSDAKLDRLIVDLLYYGAQSQIYTDHNTDALVTSALTPKQAALGTQTDRELISAADTRYAVIENAQVKWLGAGLVLNKAIVMNIAFSPSDAAKSVVVKDEDGNTVTAVTNFTVSSQNAVATFDRFTPAQLSQTFYFTVCDENGDPLSDTLSYSVESYAVSAIARAKADEKYASLAGLARAMMRYGDSAKEYAG